MALERQPWRQLEDSYAGDHFSSGRLLPGDDEYLEACHVCQILHARHAGTGKSRIEPFLTPPRQAVLEID